MGEKIKSSRERMIELINNISHNRKYLYGYIVSNIKEKEISPLSQEELKIINEINLLLEEVYCFFVAQHLALNSNKIKYFEGMARNGDRYPEEHAWNELNGKIVDKIFNDEGRDYLGIEIPKFLLPKKENNALLNDEIICEKLIKYYSIEIKKNSCF